MRPFVRFKSGFVCGDVVAFGTGEVRVLQVAADVVDELGLVIEVVAADVAGTHCVVRVRVEVAEELAALVEFELPGAVAPLAYQI